MKSLRSIRKSSLSRRMFGGGCQLVQHCLWHGQWVKQGKQQWQSQTKNSLCLLVWLSVTFLLIFCSLIPQSQKDIEHLWRYKIIKKQKAIKTKKVKRDFGARVHVNWLNNGIFSLAGVNVTLREGLGALKKPWVRHLQPRAIISLVFG